MPQTSPPTPVVLVTGASSGVGLAAAHELARRGRRLALLARGEEPLRRAAEECRALGAPSVLVLPADVRDDAAVARAVAEVVRLEGSLDGVVSCAGVVAYGRLEELSADLFDAVVQTNLLGSANMLRHALPHLRARRRGSVVLVGSMIGHIAVPTMSAYTVSKWGVRALARQALVENRDVPGLHVSYVSLPGIDTPIYRQAAYAGGPAGQPPPVVWSAEKAGGLVAHVLEHPRPVTHGGAFDGVTRLGFVLLPRVFDAWVGPLFGRLASDRSDVMPPTEGNVRRSVPEDNRLEGGHGSGVGAAIRHVSTAVRRGLGRRT
ncbi:SDR family NAD(P)-dependent oxidoreductase [Terrabacter sp. C0L_2]|uniref:SDR family NAD(P)-dependent oxidoreductase n=1 Tax=Terrabacter sp. C0L_2 TaxID=3108389 RepID=UPI002ED5BF43|nr:SDR family NAD(P)-dependent oxidoreductase [Terrabacter sp. C0L_2]